jgi:hypothetical protein
VRALQADELLRVWESGALQHPLDRALTILQAAEPGATRGALASLTVPERDARLLRVRAATVGGAAAVLAACPRCGERLEFSFDTRQVLARAGALPEGVTETRHGALRLCWRLPDSRDMAAAAESGDPEAARRTLAAALLAEGWDGDAPLDPAALPEHALAALAEAMSDAAPLLDVSFSLTCPACEETWEAGLDVPAFFWDEIASRARALLHEVDALARAYHWSEAEILGLRPARRRAYLAMVGA